MMKQLISFDFDDRKGKAEVIDYEHAGETTYVIVKSLENVFVGQSINDLPIYHIVNRDKDAPLLPVIVLDGILDVKVGECLTSEFKHLKVRNLASDVIVNLTHTTEDYKLEVDITSEGDEVVFKDIHFHPNGFSAEGTYLTQLSKALSTVKAKYLEMLSNE